MAKLHKTSARLLSPFGFWVGIGAVCTAYLWQLMFGIIALAGLFAAFNIQYFEEETLVGRFVGTFIDLNSFIPGEYIGLGALGINMLISFAIFIAFTGIYFLKGFNPFGTPLLFVFAAVCLALNIFPVTNLFPWLLLWVVVTNSALYAGALSRNEHNQE